MGFEFFTDGKPVASCKIGSDSYNIIMQEYIADMPDIRKDEIIIDWEWAVGVIRHKGKADE